MKDEVQIKKVKMENVISGSLSRLSFSMEGEQHFQNCLYAPNEDMKKTAPGAQVSEEFFNKIYSDIDHILYLRDYKVELNHDLDIS